MKTDRGWVDGYPNRKELSSSSYNCQFELGFQSKKVIFH